jgi:hypothetical protein
MTDAISKANSVAVITALWECAKEKDVEVSGMSWSGFNLLGDRASIDEVRRLMHEEERFKVYRARVAHARKSP